MISVIAGRYARALVDVVLAPGSSLKGADAVAQLQQFDEAIHQSPELKAVFQNPAVSSVRKRAVIGRLVDIMGAARQIRNFLFVTVDHRRIQQLTEIREAFQLLLDDRLGFVHAEISSAQSLGDSERNRLEAQLTRLAGKNVQPRYSVDSALVGGVIARVGSTVYDGSVRGQLDALRRKLTH